MSNPKDHYTFTLSIKQVTFHPMEAGALRVGKLSNTERVVQEVANTTMRADTITELAHKLTGYVILLDENPTMD
jgi:transcriptional antiterminator Rof (Rho-off)